MSRNPAPSRAGGGGVYVCGRSAEFNARKTGSYTHNKPNTISRIVKTRGVMNLHKIGNPNTWTTSTGQVWHVENMSDQHILNVMAFFSIPSTNQERRRQYEAVQREGQRRGILTMGVGG